MERDPLQEWLRAWEADDERCLRSQRRFNCTVIVLLVLALIGLLTGSLPAHAQGVPAAAQPYRAELTRQARLVWGLDAPIATFAGQVHQESAWRADAVSRVGAQGMAQFMPATAMWWCELHRMSATECQPTNPTWALRALAAYDKWLWERIAAGDECQRMAMTLAAYNGGLGWIHRDQRLASSKGLDAGQYFGAVDTVNAGRAAWAIRENRHYPKVILHRHAPRYAAAGWGRNAC